MPADITGTEILEETGDGRRRMQFVKGPIFANVILADEINRTPPKTQAALLEAMQEHQVTAAGVRYPLEEPFFVLATQNPIEMEGTYPLPEAQLDRFLFNVIVDYLPEDDEVAVVQQTTSRKPEAIEPLFDGQDVLQFHEVVRRVPVAEELVRYAVRLASASRPGPEAPAFVNDWVSWGAGLRAAQSLILGSKARALLRGRFHVAPEDIRALIHPTFRHRILLGYRAEADGVTVDAVDRPPARTREGAPQHDRGPPTRPRTIGQRDNGPQSDLIDPQTLMRIKSLQVRRPGRGRGVLQGHPPQPVSTASRSSSANTASTRPATTRVTSTGGSMPDPTAITSSGSRTRPTCAATWCSTPAGRWATARATYSKSDTPGRWRPRSPTSSRPSATRSA